eukprot:m.476810 g.476810  ORF g.476810 m.476810 type:complete len:70 (-) comp20661_c0_seq1:1279-1488(-)
MELRLRGDTMAPWPCTETTAKATTRATHTQRQAAILARRDRHVALHDDEHCRAKAASNPTNLKAESQGE